jgi:hypothetical protein
VVVCGGSGLVRDLASWGMAAGLVVLTRRTDTTVRPPGVIPE